MSLISCKNLNKSYGEFVALENVNFSIEPGQIVGLVGPNGAGKTTCLQSMLGLTSYEGDVDMLGFNPNQNRTAMLNEVAYIADVAVLPAWLKVSQALNYMHAIHPNFSLDKANKFLAKTNIKRDAKVKSLSKGMITQLHLALILAVDAKILILDEPTLGLDILTRRQFYTHLLEEFYTPEKAIIITTHQIEEIEHILTDILFIKAGKIVLSESAENIKQRFTLLAVQSENVEKAQALNPVSQQKLLGLTSMLFDDVEKSQLDNLGNISVPSLADVFVSVMEGGTA